MLLIVKKHLDDLSDYNNEANNYHAAGKKNSYVSSLNYNIHDLCDYNFFYDAYYLKNKKLSYTQHNSAIFDVISRIKSHKIKHFQICTNQASPANEIVKKFFLSKKAKALDNHLKKAIITIGGDGTLLFCSSLIDDDTTLIGLKSTAHSVGHLCSASRTNINELINLYLKNQLKIKKVSRLKAIIIRKKFLDSFKKTGSGLARKEVDLIDLANKNNIALYNDSCENDNNHNHNHNQNYIFSSPYALNDILFTSKNPGSACRYIVRYNKLFNNNNANKIHHKNAKKDLNDKCKITHRHHISSGVWVYTATGSSAGAFAAGAPSLEEAQGSSSLFGYQIRELYKSCDVYDNAKKKNDHQSFGEYDFFDRLAGVNDRVHNLFWADNLFDSSTSLYHQAKVGYQKIKLCEADLINQSFMIKNLSNQSCLIIDGRTKIDLNVQDLVLFVKAKDLNLAQKI